ncbi:MAG: hypothetical protein SGI72_05735 [Planctomycetota bacterium]|nr:hypothetical protein [Planctomycetota bacterium]
MARSSTSGRSKSGGFISHRVLIAVEALLFLGVAKDWVFALLLRSSLPNWGKVALVMATTIGLFGGFFLVVGRLMSRTVKTTHKAAERLPFALPTLAIHGLLLFVLFLLYASMLKLSVF